MLIPLLVAAALLFSSLLVYGLAMHFVVRVVVKLIRSGHNELTFWGSTAVMAIVTLIVSAGHLTQIVLWALAYWMGGEVPTLGTAIYFSALSYTAIGSDGIRLSERWRFHCPLEAMEGAVFFGLSTAVLFAVMNHLIAGRLRIESGNHGEASGNQAPFPATRVMVAPPAPVARSDDHGGPSSPRGQSGVDLGSPVALAVPKGALG